MTKKLMISAGEASGELYGALLSREVKKLWAETEIFGIGGARMENEGVSLIAPVSHVVGIVEAVTHLKEIKNTLKKATDALTGKRPDVLVLIDYPDFNIALAERARAAGIPILYYVSPQVWAWRGGRVKKIASLVNRMAVLFPFEADYYKDTGLPCEFVGHPIVETINIQSSKRELKKTLGLDPDKGVITLLPGSRPGEIKRHQAIIKDVAEKIHHEFPEMQTVVPLTAESPLPEGLPDHVKVVRSRTAEAVACSEASAVASGTATLEATLLYTPMVVFYKVSFLTYHIVKLMARVKFISLVNILSGKEVVKELLQKEADPDRIFTELKKILTDASYRDAMISELKNIGKIMQGKKPSARVACIVGEMAGWSGANAPV
ncbi:MAG: lipid-A-disaccharide synthase [Nitrospirae bacterium]|nr:lipid-A-disaccharide synthase [Nitrospirota bacterium]